MTIYRRSDWGAAPPKAPLNYDIAPGDSLVVHHTGGGAAPASVPDAMAMLRGIQSSHMNGDYTDIAYNMACDQFGNIYECRGMDAQGAATYSANDRTRAVVWLGNSDVETPSPQALAAIASLFASEVGRNLKSNATITGHRDWTPTACPGETLYGQLPTIRSYTKPIPSEETDEMMRSLRTATGTIVLADRLHYTVMPGSWPEVELALRQMVAAGELLGNPDGSPKLWDANDSNIGSRKRL